MRDCTACSLSVHTAIRCSSAQHCETAAAGPPAAAPTECLGPRQSLSLRFAMLRLSPSHGRRGYCSTLVLQTRPLAAWGSNVAPSQRPRWTVTAVRLGRWRRLRPIANNAKFFKCRVVVRADFAFNLLEFDSARNLRLFSISSSDRFPALSLCTPRHSYGRIKLSQLFRTQNLKPQFAQQCRRKNPLISHLWHQSRQ